MENSHTSQNICDDFWCVLKEYGLENKKIVCVTDSAANMVAACRLIGNHRVPCIAHKTNSLIQKDMLHHPSVKEIPALLAKIREGQKKLIYRFDELRQLKDKDNQNQMSLFLNEISELEEIVDAEGQYSSEDDTNTSNFIRNLDHGRNEFSGLKTFSNIRFGCVFKLSSSYKNNSST